MTSADHKEELQKSEYHIPAKQMTAERSGCVTKCVGSQMPKRSGKHGSYRKNGYDTIVADPDKKKIYNRTFTDPSPFAAPSEREEKPWGTKKAPRNLKAFSPSAIMCLIKLLCSTSRP